MSYDPQSSDAMFSRVMQRLEDQDHTLSQILIEVRKTNGRVTSLETTRAVTKGQIALISVLVSAAFAFVSWVFTAKP